MVTSEIKTFIRLAGGNDAHLINKKYNFAQNLTYKKKGKNTELVDFIVSNYNIIPESLGHSYVFDFFYDKAMDSTENINDHKFWKDALKKVITLMPVNHKTESIKRNKKYVLELQSGSRNYTDIFHLLITSRFDIGKQDFLLYSIIARGELDKLKILDKIMCIEHYPGIYSTAVRFGRSDMIQYLHKECKLSLKQYGDILNLEGYVDNFRYLRYTKQLASVFYHKIPINGSKYDHVKCIDLLYEYGYSKPITVNTLNQWCSLLRNMSVHIEEVDSSSIIRKLMDHINEPVPLTMDFDEFNYFIFGPEWSDRYHIITYCQHLERKVARLEGRCEKLSKHRVLRDRNCR